MVRVTVAAVCFLAYQGLSGYELRYTAPETQGLSSEGMAKISEWSAKYVEEGRLAGMVTLVARGGDVVHFEAMGQRGSEDPRPLTRDALFRIYSMTKPVTSAAIMMLIDDGALSLDDRVVKYLPELASLTVLRDGERLPQVPAHRLVVQLGYAHPILQATIQGRYLGKQYENDINSIELGDFAVIDLSIARPLGADREVFLRIQVG